MKTRRGVLHLAGLAVLSWAVVTSGQGQEGQSGVQSSLAVDPGFVEIPVAELAEFDFDELPLNGEGVVDDDDYMDEEVQSGPALVSEDVQAIPDDRPLAFLDEMVDG